MVDNHELEKEAMKCFLSGEIRRAQQLQTEFLNEVKDSGEDYCSCKERCRYHGKCVDCVILHRGHGEHLPACFQDMVNKRIDALSALTEHSIKSKG